MANRNSEVKITVDSTQPVAALRAMKNEIKRLEEQYKKLDLSTKAGQKRAAEMRREMNTLESACKNTEAQLIGVGKVIDNLSNANLRQLNQALRQVKKQMNLVDGRDLNKIKELKNQYAALTNEINKRNKQLGMTNNLIGKQGSAWNTTLRNMTAYFGVFQLFSKAQQMITGVIKSNLALSDSLADIRKVSQLSMEDINELSRNLAKIDTRTSVEELNKIAYAGAKLGIGEYGVEGLTQFTRAANQLNVALKEDLGEDALPAVAKLTENMGLLKSMGVEKGMLAVSSSIFKLAASSTAAGGPIVEFSKRIAALAKGAGITTDQLLALGSASDSMMLMPEVAATAFNKMITAMQRQHNLIEKSLSIEPGTINNLFKTGNMMQAIVTVFEKMKEKGNMNALGSVFKDLGSDGARLNLVMATMAQNVDMLKKHLDISSKAFKEGTAVTEEYIIQQNTANALMERAGQLWVKAFVNPKGVDTVKDLAQAWYDMSKSLTENKTFIESLKFSLSALLTVVKVALWMLPALANFLLFKGVSMAVMTAAKSLWEMRTAIMEVMKAQKALSIAAASSWNGALAAAVGFVVSAYVSWRTRTDEVTESQIGLKKALAEATVEADKQTSKLDAYKQIAEDVTLTEQQRHELIKKFNSEYRQYIDKLGIEINTVDDLKEAYKKLNDELRKKQFYEFRERYKQQQTEGLQVDRLTAGMKYREELQKMGVEGAFDTEWLQQHATQGVTNIYDSIMRAVNKNRKKPVGTNKALGDAIKTYLDAYQKETSKNNEIDKMFASEVGDYDPVQQAILGELTNEKPDKDAIKVGDGLQDQKKAWRQDMKQAQDEAKAIIDNIKNFYERQITEVLKTANEQNWDTTLTETAVRAVEGRMNLALSQARKSIAGVKNNWDEFKQTMTGDMREMADEVGYNESQVLLDNIQENNLAALRAKIVQLSKNLNMPESAATDAISKNATLNQKANETAEQKQRKEINKRLFERNYTGKMDDEYTQSMETMGFFNINDEQLATMIAGDDKAKALIQKRSDEILQVLQNAREHILDLYDTDVSTEGGRNQLMAILFGPDWDQDNSELKAVFDLYGDDLQVFYDELLKYSDAYTEALKKSHDREKKIFQERWDRSGAGETFSEAQQGLGMMQRENALTGADKGVNFAQQSGFAAMGEDPEVAASLLRMEQARQELELVRQISEDKKLIHEKEQAFNEAEMAAEEAVMSKIGERISKLQEWTDPIEQFGAEVGDAMGKAVFESESMAEGMKKALASMAKSWGEHTIKIVKELMLQRLKEKVIHKAMMKDTKNTEEQQTEMAEESGEARLEARSLVETGIASVTQQMGQEVLNAKKVQDSEEMAAEGTKATGSVLAGIAEGAAKIIGTLGPWGAPLIAVITALLMGLLTMALNALGGGGGEDSADTGPKVKLVSGMLTYDSGNVQSFSPSSPSGNGGARPVVASDGRVYNANEGGQLQTGLVTSPVTTMINGQPSIVGERGPEMVIGRETTHAMQMNRPDLLREIVKFDRHRSGMTYRAYDDGNIGDLAGDLMGDLDINVSGTAGGGLTSDDISGFRTAVEGFTQMMLQIQRNGLHVNKYGRGGLVESAADGADFLSRQTNNRLYKRK